MRILLFTFAVCLGLHADDWPRWRGPSGNGISKETGWNAKWPDSGPAILWKAKLGVGFSSISVAGGKVVSIGNEDGQDTVFCFDALSGKELWKHSYAADLGDKFFEGGPTATPTISGDRVFTLSRWGDAFCFELGTGKVLWNRNVQNDTGSRVPGWGFGGSPVVFEKMLLLNVGEGGLALDKDTGKTVWQTANKEAGYTTPVVRNSEIVLGNSQAYLGVEVATGKEIWRYKWLTQYGVNAADPIVDGDRVFIASGYGKGCALIKPGKEGEPETIWKSKVLRSQMNGPILFNKFLYGVDGDSTDKPTLKCVDINTGEVKWSDVSSVARSLIIVDGNLLVLGERGELLLAPATPDGFKPVSRAQVLGGKCWTSPAFANGLLYARNARGDMVCADLRGSSAK